MDNLTKQKEEIESLKAIYGSEFQIEDDENRKYSITIVSDCDSNIYVKLYVKFSDSYPSISPPTFEISAPHLKHENKLHLFNLLNDIYLSHIGQNVIFQWIEKIREELQSLYSKSIEKLTNNDYMNVKSNKLLTTSETEITCPIISHGEVISDRKSSFQGHAAIVRSSCQVRNVIMKLKENRKIQQAAHNMYAYRIYDENTKNYLQDCNDDGESQGGSRLLNLLQS
ncbi:PREDICTED: protein IMPACT-like isoform X2 [Ceratosolen solmsi marchali]|uniref:Protein IMPACT-like isoform X2 n=1 Tax=Ceratosolen solmsi marchali TaxID=326594 RepID=A0AAJ6YGZ4_9HYME|nr:PREDICTED: protein IMPACT-like isoform X2 [Ceratosolen solmsi marchali]